MEKEEEGYKFPSRFYILITKKDGSHEIMGTQSLQGFTEQSGERHLGIAMMIPNVVNAEVKEVKNLFDMA